nr:(2Fe-2S)-binding protein [Archaeoglobus neptunius]
MEINRAVAEDENFGEIVCICNMVSKAEILNALEEGRCFDTVKHLTRAGMDCCRCHASIIRIMYEHAGEAKKEIEGSDIAWSMQ